MKQRRDTAEALFDEEDDRIDREMDVHTHNRTSPYNHFGYKRVTRELRHVPAPIEGKLPSDLSGVYVRNGTNPQFAKAHVRLHCFNGAGMLHQIEFLDGQAYYSNTYIRTPVFEFEREAGREVFPVFSDRAGGGVTGQQRIDRFERKVKEGRIPTNGYLEYVQSSTAVQVHSDRLFCLAESGLPFAVNVARGADGLMVIDGSGRFESWGGDLRHTFSAHPRIDPKSGDFYSVSVDRATLSVHVAHLSKNRVVRSAAVYKQTPETGFMAAAHDCFITENYIVFFDASLRTSRQWAAEPGGSIFRFLPEKKLRWGIIPRQFDQNTRVRWFETERPGFIWHLVNAWERTRPDGGKEIVMYGPMFHGYPATMPIHTPEEPPAKLNKWVLDLDRGVVAADQILLDHGYERPSLNLDYVGRESRFAYLLDEEKSGYMGQGVLKYDLLSEKEIAYVDYRGLFGGEALFVPRKEAVAEDDGYLLDLLMGPDSAELIVIDASEMKEVARVHLPQRVPFGVHACWINDATRERMLNTNVR